MEFLPCLSPNTISWHLILIALFYNMLIVEVLKLDDYIYLTTLMLLFYILKSPLCKLSERIFCRF